MRGGVGLGARRRVGAPRTAARASSSPTTKGLVQTEFEKNIPFALSVAESADDPANPVSVVGREAEDFRVDTFDVSYGDPQTVAVDRQARDQASCGSTTGSTTARRSPSASPSGAAASATATRTTATTASSAARSRARAPATASRSGSAARRRARAGGTADDDVESAPFTYTVKQDTGAKVLVLADEDYTGVNPDYPPGTNAPQYAAAHLAAVRAAGYSADLWDLDKDGVPHDLGILSHYEAIVWYLGDNRYTQDPEDELIDTAGIFGAGAAGHRRRRARAVPHDGRARLPQRGRQADPHG